MKIIFFPINWNFLFLNRQDFNENAQFIEKKNPGQILIQDFSRPRRIRYSRNGIQSTCARDSWNFQFNMHQDTKWLC